MTLKQYKICRIAIVFALSMLISVSITLDNYYLPIVFVITAAAAMYRAEGRGMDTEPPFRFVTASLRVDFLKPTPMGELVLRGRVKEIKGRKVVVEAAVHAGDAVTARGEIVTVRMPETFLEKP